MCCGEAIRFGGMLHDDDGGFVLRDSGWWGGFLLCCSGLGLWWVVVGGLTGLLGFLLWVFLGGDCGWPHEVMRFLLLLLDCLYI